MTQKRNAIGIIPARGNSKGLPGKNIKNIHGKPLIAWSIEAALQSRSLEEVVVTTDSPEIAEVAKKYGATVPFLRPPHLALDTSPTFDAILHCLDFYKTEKNTIFDYVTLLEPTSPLREAKDIDLAFEKLVSQKVSSIVGVCKTVSTNPAFLVEMKPDGRLSYLSNSVSNGSSLRRQDIQDIYFFEGTIYISKTDTLIEKKTFYHEDTLGYEVPKWKSLEIDDEWDLIMAEAIMKHRALAKTSHE